MRLNGQGIIFKTIPLVVDLTPPFCGNYIWIWGGENYIIRQIYPPHGVSHPLREADLEK